MDREGGILINNWVTNYESWPPIPPWLEQEKGWSGQRGRVASLLADLYVAAMRVAATAKQDVEWQDLNNVFQLIEEGGEVV